MARSSESEGEDIENSEPEDHRGDNYEDGDEELEEQVDREELFEPVVQSLVAALGGYEQTTLPNGSTQLVYRPGDSILPVLRSLKKLWRRDDTDDERTVFRLFARSSLVSELIALIKECTERGEWGRKIALASVDLLAAVTWPIEVEKELRELRDEEGLGGEGVSDYATLLKAQWTYKAMILQPSSSTIRSLMLLLLPSLAKQGKDRTERDKKIVSLMLFLVRNLLSIGDAAGGGGGNGEGSLQSELIKQLSQYNFFNLFNTLANNAATNDYNEYNVVILDILFLAYKGVDPAELVKDRETARKDGLAGLLMEEDRERRMKDRKGVSRHGRFGTTIAVRSGSEKYVLHKQTAISDSAANVLDGIKKSRAQKAKQSDELNRGTELKSDALKVLHDFAELFLQSFDPFFSSVLKDIRMSRSKVRETDNLRALFLSRFFMEYFLLLRVKEQQSLKEAKAARAKKAEVDKAKAKRDQVLDPWTNMLGGDSNPLGEGPSRLPAQMEPSATASAEEEDETKMTFGLMAEMLEDNTRLWLNKRLRDAFDVKPPAFVEIQACMNFSTQFLTLLECMSADKDEEWQDAALNVSDKVFYHAEFVESAFEVLASYRDQSMGYLDSAVEFVYTLLKTLEKYTKQRGQLVVRKRLKAGSKRKSDALKERENGDDDDEEGGGVENRPSYRETEVQFRNIEAKLLNERVTKSLMAYLSRWREFNEEAKLKRVVGLMHRMAVKRTSEELFYKVSGLILFKAILDDQRLLPKHQSSKDLVSLIQFILRKFFKSAQEQPLKLAEAFFPAHISRTSIRGDVSDSEDERAPKAVRIPAEIEFKPDKVLQWHEKMGIAMHCLLEENKMPLVTWLLEELRMDAATRHAAISAVDDAPDAMTDDEGDVVARRGPSMRAKEQLEERALATTTEDQSKAATYDSHFKLMLTLVSYRHIENEEKPVPFSWVMPKAILPGDIDSSISIIEQYLREPYDIDGESAKAMLKKKRKKPIRRPRSDSDTERRRANRGTRIKKQAEVQAFKSAAFIVDSDDDPEADEVFFAKEAERRAAYKAQGSGDAGGDGAKMMTKRQKKKKGASLVTSSGSGEEEDNISDGDESTVRVSSVPGRLPDTPSTSTTSPQKRQQRRKTTSASESSSPSRGVPVISDNDDDDDEEEEEEAVMSVTRRVKKRIVAVSDEED